MTLKRLIPILLVKNGLLVRSEKFTFHQAIGDPIPTIKRLSDWNADEIVLLNIGSNDILDSRREDKYHNLGESKFEELVTEVTKFCHCPITIGGGIHDLNDIENMFNAGADKVIINTSLYDNPKAITSAVDRYADCARAMGVAQKEDSDEEANKKLLNELEDINKELNVPSPKEFGIDREDFMNNLEIMAEQALASGSPGNNPRVPDNNEIINIYKLLWT